MVGGGSFFELASSTNVVPSRVQKLNHSSSKDRLQLGQRFTVSCLWLLYALHHKRQSIDQDDERNHYKIEPTQNNPDDAERLSAILIRVILDLHQRDNPENDGCRTRQRANVTAKKPWKADYSQDKRRDREPLFRFFLVSGWWRRLP